MQDRPKRCILFSATKSQIPKICEFQVERSNLSVSLPLLRPGASTQDIYKTTEGSYFSDEEAECSIDNFSGRYSTDGCLGGGVDIGTGHPQLIGRLASTAIAVLPAPLQYRPMQCQQILELSVAGNYSSEIKLSDEVKAELQWWVQNLHLNNGVSVISPPPPPQLLITSDASLEGWGAFCQGHKTGRQWTLPEKKDHINILELRAAKYAILTLPNCKNNPYKNGQHCCSFLFGKNGRYSKSITCKDQQGNLGIFTGQGDHNYCRVPPRSPLQGGRHAVMNREGFKRMEIKSSGVSKPLQILVDPRYRPFRFQSFPSSSSLSLGNWIHTAKAGMPCKCVGLTQKDMLSPHFL